MFQFDIGDKVKDSITGYIGVIIIRSEHLTGCNRYAVQHDGLTKDGRPSDLDWFDEMTLKFISKSKFKKIAPAGPGAG